MPVTTEQRQIVLIFVAGAAATAFVDHEVGTMDRTSLRWAYVLMGVVLMVTAVLWLRSIRANSVPREARFPMIAECVC